MICGNTDIKETHISEWEKLNQERKQALKKYKK